MATQKGSTSPFSVSKQGISTKRFGLVVSQWHSEITGALQQAAESALIANGVKPANIVVQTVPGSFELPLGSQGLAKDKTMDAVIALGCVIRGETPHFDYICQAVAQGIKDVALKFDKPVIFGVLTTHTHQQALDRAGGKLGNKGEEAALTALAMLNSAR